MNFQGLQAKYRRLFQESTAWKLLRAANAPMILAFLADLFSEENEISFSRARVVLDAELMRCRELGIWETETNAGSYLNEWIRSGWLREMDDMLTKTDASEIAFRFCRGLDERSTGTTASHLRIVQEAVRDFRRHRFVAAFIRCNIIDKRCIFIALRILNQKNGTGFSRSVRLRLNATLQVSMMFS